MKTKFHQDLYRPRLLELARRCGIELKPLRSFVDGTTFLSIVHPDEKYRNTDVCGEYGEAFAEALKDCRWRTGEAQYGFHTGIKAFNGWAWFIEGDLVRALDSAGIPETIEKEN